MPLELVSVVIATVGNIFLGLFTLLKNPKSATGKLFFSFTFVLALYLAFNYTATHQVTDAGAAFWVRLVMTNAVGINVLFYLLVDTFPSQKIRTKPLILWASILVSALLVPMTQTDLIFSSVSLKNGTIQSTPGAGMPAFLLHTVVYLGGGFLWLISRFRKSRGIEKTQTRFFLAGTVFMFLSLLITNLVLVVVFNNAAFVGLLPLYTLVFVGCISYAMVRHRFFDINLLVVRIVMYTLFIAIIAVGFSFVTSVLGRLFLRIHFTPEEQATLIGITVVISLLFQRIRHGIERITDRIFYKGRYETNDVLSALSHVMASTLRLEDLAHGLLDILLRELRISQGAFVLIRDGVVTDVLSQGYHPFPTVDEEDMKLLSTAGAVLNVDDLEAGTVTRALGSLGASVVVPMRTEGALIGLLVLGPKSSGDIYSPQDLSLLEIFAPEAAVAIQNALAYEEIRRFSITLQKEVDRATEDLRQANIRLKELDKLKDEFVSLASHELRAPLTSIRSYLWMARSNKGGDLTEKQRFYLDRSFMSTDRLIKLVNDMLNISRIESGRLAMQFVRSPVAGLIDEAFGEVQPKLEEQGQIFTKKIPDGLPDVIVDRDKVKEVFINLMTNAIKFTPRNGNITLSVVQEGEMLRIVVTDTGMGFAKEDADKLFRKFSTVTHEANKRQVYQSTGLGLYISKSIVEMHSGTVNASSPGPGKGATFGFTLPVFTKERLESLQNRYASEGLGIIHNAIS